MENVGGGEDEVSSEVQTVSSRVPMGPNPELRKLLVFKVYKRRWFVLFVLCLMNCSNAMLWLTFAPVADQSAQYLKVGLEEINWLSMIYMVVAIPVSFGTTWMLDTVGLRVTLILGSALNMFGALLRFLGTPPSHTFAGRYIIVMAGQTLCSLAQPLIIFTPTKLAALWFPDHQRATANTIASMSNPLGVLLANIISPLMAPTAAQIPNLMLVYAVPACVICVLAIVGIRSSAPPTPPSASAEAAASEPFIQGIKLLLKNKAYLILLLCFGSGIAVFTCFSTLLEQILCVQGYTNNFAGLCGALFIVFGIVGAGALGLFVDKTKMFNEATKINMSFTALACIAFAVSEHNNNNNNNNNNSSSSSSKITMRGQVSLMPQQEVAVAAVCSLFGFFGFSIYPVAMELSVECSYPVGEATSAGLIFVSGQVQSVLYIVLLQALTKRLADSPLSTCGDAVLSWRVPTLVLAGLCSVFSCCFVLFFNTRYRRLEAEEAATYGTSQTNDTAPGFNNNTDNNDNAPSVDTRGNED
ncbi:hypothetical protein INR49_031494 [Caranx melampygus]|nr:hypothetical protein INR49_031494 [Caranx melampygus]